MDEYNKILNSIHVLNIIHDMQLRKVLKTARNRTESYHSLQGLIRKVYNGVFKGKKIANTAASATDPNHYLNAILHECRDKFTSRTMGRQQSRATGLATTASEKIAQFSKDKQHA